MQNQRCVRCFQQYDPADNVFGSCTWHSNHNLAQSNRQYISLEDELRSYLPKLKSPFGKVDVDYVVKRIPLRDLMLQVDSTTTRAISGKLESIPGSISSVLVQYTLEKLYEVIPSRYSYDKQYPGTRRIALIMENMLNSMRIQDIDELLGEESARLDKEFRYPHQHLYQGKKFDKSKSDYIWSCCGLPGSSVGCWKGVHSSNKRSPDPITVEGFDILNFRAFYDNTNLIINGSEHINNKLTNEILLNEISSSRTGVLLDEKKKKLIQRIIAFNAFNGYEATLETPRETRNYCAWVESQRIQSAREVDVSKLVTFKNGLNLISIYAPRFELSEYVIYTVIQKIVRSKLRDAVVLTYGSAQKIDEVFYLPRYIDSRLPEGTLLLPNEGTSTFPKNPVKVTNRTTVKFEKLSLIPRTQRGKYKAKVAALSARADVEWAPYFAERQAQLNAVLDEYNRQRREAAKLVKRKTEADDVIAKVEQYALDSAQIPGSENYAKLVEKLVKEQYAKLADTPLADQKALIAEMETTAELAAFSMAQMDLENQLKAGTLAIDYPLTSQEIQSFESNLNAILQQAGTLRSDYENALASSKASPETIELGKQILLILDAHMKKLQAAAPQTKYENEANLIVTSGDSIVQTYARLSDLFSKGKIGQKSTAKIAAPDNFRQKLIKIDKRAKKWHLRSTLSTTATEDMIAELQKFYVKLKNFIEVYSPVRFSQNLPLELKTYASKSETELTQALEKIAKGGLLPTDEIFNVAKLIESGVESARIWHVNLRSGSGEQLSAEEKQNPVFYEKIRSSLLVEKDLGKENFNKMLKLADTKLQAESGYMKARIFLFRTLLNFCYGFEQLRKFVYPLHDWVQAYLSHFRSIMATLHASFDPIFCIPVGKNFETNPNLIVKFLVQLFSNGYSTMSYETQVKENLAVLKELNEELKKIKTNVPMMKSVIQAVTIQISLVESNFKRVRGFLDECYKIESKSFFRVDDMFSNWGSIEKLDKTFGPQITNLDSKNLLELNLEIYTSLSKLALYFGKFYVSNDDAKIVVEIKDLTVEEVSTNTAAAFKGTIELFRSIQTQIAWTKRFRSEEDLVRMNRLWIELNFPTSNAQKYITQVKVLLEYLGKMQLFVNIDSGRIRDILKLLEDPKAFAKTGSDIVLPLRESCKVKPTRYILPFGTFANKFPSTQQLQEAFSKNLADLERTPKFFVHPPKGKKLRVKRRLPIHLYPLK